MTTTTFRCGHVLVAVDAVSDSKIEVRHFTAEMRPGRVYEIAHLSAGVVRVDRVIPPAGLEYAFARTTYRREVQVSVSPNGRSVRVFVDGREVKP